MKRGLFLLFAAVALGIGAGECLTSSFFFRHWIGQVTGRGQLEALVNGTGIYDTDLWRAWQGERFALGAGPEKMPLAARQRALERSIAEAKLAAAARDQPVDSAALAQEIDLLRWQFPDDQTWQAALQTAGLNTSSLKGEVASNLRMRRFLEHCLAGKIQPNDAKVRAYFATHQPAFQLPPRFRARHLFLAAPEGYPPEVIERKKTLIAELSRRIGHGESFPVLVTQFSEDDATRGYDGDLDYFAAERMLPAVFAAAQRLRPGEISSPVRSRLGFHILRLTESRPARTLTLAEAKPEIETLLANQKRAALMR